MSFNSAASAVGWCLCHAIIDARAALLRYLGSLHQTLEVVTDAPEYDWMLFCELAHSEGQWPHNMLNAPTNAVTQEACNDGSPLPHHALLDARIIAGMFKQ